MEVKDDCIVEPLLSGQKQSPEHSIEPASIPSPDHLASEMKFCVPKGTAGNGTAAHSFSAATIEPAVSVKETDGVSFTNSSKKPEVVVHPPEDAVSIISSIPGDMCRICHCYSESAQAGSMISPCKCDGSMKYVHQACLQKWVKSRDTKKCELCGVSYNMTSSVKPFRQWKKLDMSSVERRKVLCSVTFHVVAITCVIWSLYVLIDKTAEEIHNGKLNWPFWTKLVVVAIGFTGGLVFMYVQCKMYVQLFRKWKQFNRVIYINDIELGDLETNKSSQIDSNDSAEDIVVVHISQANTPPISTPAEAITTSNNTQS